jgi:dihydrolipoamide dehydrogenase
MLKSLARRFSSFDFDVAVVGGGPGGYVAAIKASQLGLKTACIEKRTTLGGTCLNVGCIPAKSLLNTTHKYMEASKEFARHGIQFEGLRFDVPSILKTKQKSVDGLTKGIEGLFKKNKVTHIRGFGKFKGDHELDVSGQKVTAKNIIIATGSEPSNVPGGFLPIDEKTVLSNTGAMELPSAPKKLVVVGAGVIGLELGSVWSRLGTEVVFVEFLSKVAGPTDLEISNALQKVMEKQGMKFLLGTKVVGAEISADSVKLSLEGKETSIEGDKVLVAVGRKAFTEGLGLETIGIPVDKQGRIEVNRYLQTKHSHIYAVGDCIKGMMLAHKAEEEGVFVAEHIAGHLGHVNYENIPSVIYTYPEVASVGKTEEQLKELGVEYKKGTFPFLANSRARANHDSDGFIKVLTDARTDRLLGCHFLGPNAGELIMEAALAMEYKAASEDVARTSHAHPGFCEAFKEACLSAHSKAIHF